MLDAVEFTLDDGMTVAVTSPARPGSSQAALGDRLQVDAGPRAAH